MKTIDFLGGGRITKIFLQAFQNVDLAFEKVTVYDVNEEALMEVKSQYPRVYTTSNMDEIATSEVVILAVHPIAMMEVLGQLKGKLRSDSILLSLSPKFTIKKISETLDNFPNIARMNPSASTIVNRGVNPIAFSDSFDLQKKNEILNLFKPLGLILEIADSKIEAYAVISAMGHTYFNFQLQKLKDLAVSFGMDEREASKTISSMLWGTTETLFYSGMSYDEVSNLVPVKPMAEVEEEICGYYEKYLTGIYNKIKP
jgi:pyrroline-5-carboxylate reductase